ncbi:MULTISPECIES: alanine racemase [unclassified Thioalkalivibrio]|uniref:alanine racemase n=1 Tax=unclassified Thioalkalivibrio TaxID=2621013 RepID=UPI00036BA576|nr:MULTISPECIES: alanine racemase [unclassified Thioalkalivibrio]
MKRAATLQLHPEALRHNLAVARRLAPGAPMWSVIKAEGYGHGLLWAAEVLGADSDGLAVSQVGEARALRAAGFGGPLLVLQGPRDVTEAHACIEFALQPVVHDPAQLELLDVAGVTLPEVWVKVNTGMNRLGFEARRAGEVAARLQATGHGHAGLHWMTHLACADAPDHPQNARQLACFADTVAAFPGYRSVANSASLFAGWGRGGDAAPAGDYWARPGIMLYGAHPASVPEARPPEGPEGDLRPAMTVRAPIIATQSLEPGESVGYGATWTASGPGRAGIVAMGYADGYPRHAPSGTPVRVQDRICPLIGRVSMDMLAVDLSGVPEAQVGDMATLWGEGLPVERVARAAGTISYELLTRVADRLQPAR